MGTDEPYTIPVFPEDPDRMRMMVTDSKLGGYIVGGDPDTYTPKLWDWIVEKMGVRFVLDIGCGEGHALRYFREKGCEVLGIDAIAQSDPDIIRHNYREGSVAPSGEDVYFDLAWSCEFVEHVAEEHVPNFMETFKCARVAMITHATPGQGGFNHVNEQPAEYWMCVFTAHGFRYDDELTQKARRIAREHGPGNYFGQSGLVFRR